MMKLKRINLILLILLSLALTTPADAATSLVEAGKKVYEKYCVGCHGERGDGKGRGTKLLVVKPRDFTTGIYKFKSTLGDSLPTDEDLMRTLVRGLPGSSMPSYRLLSEVERQSVIAYIKTFSPRWQKERPPSPVTIPSTPSYVGSTSSVEKGRAIYTGKGGCTVCHGEKGDGKGPLWNSLKDNWGNPVKPANLERGVFRAGNSPQDLFRTLKVGVAGTPMPGFGGTLTDEEIWHLVSYILSLKGGK